VVVPGESKLSREATRQGGGGRRAKRKGGLKGSRQIHGIVKRLSWKRAESWKGEDRKQTGGGGGGDWRRIRSGVGSARERTRGPEVGRGGGGQIGKGGENALPED